jgi:hypothetical protein
MDESVTKLLDIFTAIIAAASAVLALLAVLFWMQGSSRMLWSQEAAGWAQAIGSVIAIGVAIVLSRRQSRDANRVMIEADLRQLLRRLDSFRGIVNSANTQMRNVADDLLGVKIREIRKRPPSPANPEDDRMYMTMALDHMRGKHPFIETLAIIDAIPLHDLGSSDLVEAVRDLKNAVQSFAIHIEHALSVGEDNYSSTSLWNSPHYGRVLPLKRRKNLTRLRRRSQQLISEEK